MTYSLRALMRAVPVILISLCSPAFAASFSGKIDLKDPPPTQVIEQTIISWANNRALDLERVKIINASEQPSPFGPVAIVNFSAEFVASEPLFVFKGYAPDGGPRIYDISLGKGETVPVSGRFEAVRIGEGWDAHLVVKDIDSLHGYVKYHDMGEGSLMVGSAQYYQWFNKRAAWKTEQLAALKGSWVGMFSCKGHTWNIEKMVVENPEEGAKATISEHLARKKEPVEQAVSFKLDERNKTVFIDIKDAQGHSEWYGKVEPTYGYLKLEVSPSFSANCDPFFLYPEDDLPSEVVEYREELAKRLAKVTLGKHDAMLIAREEIPSSAVVDKVEGNLVKMTITHPQRTSGGALKANQKRIQSDLWIRFASFPEFRAAIGSRRVDEARHGGLILWTCDYTTKIHENGMIEAEMDESYSCGGKVIVK